jgi:hypothetical protein
MGFSLSKNKNENEANITSINKIINDIISTQNLLINHETILLKKIRGSDEEAKNYISIGNKQKAMKCLKYKKHIQIKLKNLTNYKKDLDNIAFSIEYNSFPQKNKYLICDNIIPKINQIQNIIININIFINNINIDNDNDNNDMNVNPNINNNINDNVNDNYIYDENIDGELQFLTNLNTPDTNKIIIK